MPRQFEKYILLTGGAGFIGTNFLERFVNKYPQYHFTVIDKLTYVSDYDATHISRYFDRDNFVFLQKDLFTDYQFLYDLLVNDGKIKYVIHMAAESSVDRSFNSPIFFTQNNVVGSQNLLDCIRLSNAKHSLPIKLINLSTDEVYGEQSDFETVDEKGTLLPTNPYAATKGAVDLIVQAYGKAYNIPITIVRSNNVYGPGQHEEKLIPMILYSLKSGNKMTIHGNGTNQRSYLHIDDFLDAVDLVWHSEHSSGEIYNIGTCDEIDNLSLARLISEIYLGGAISEFSKYVEFVEDRNYNDLRYSISSEKISKLGWKQKVCLQDGIKALVKGLEQ